MPGGCVECGARLADPARGRPRRYCSRRCQARAYRRRRDLGRTATPHRRSAGPPAGGEATRERLVHIAIELADADGIEAVSVRAVAHRAGLSADRVHRWVRNRDDLVGAMVERVLLDDRARAAARPTPTDPREHLAQLARQEWELYRRHPWLLPVLATTRPPTSRVVLDMVGRTVAVLIRAGYRPDDAFAAYLAVSGYVQGMALLPVAERAEQRAGAPAWETWWPATRARLAAAGWPSSHAWLPAAGRYDRDPEATFDRWFDFGLARLLDGLVTVGHSGGDPA